MATSKIKNESTDFKYQFRIGLIGDMTVGKTSVVNFLLDIKTKIKPTLDADFHFKILQVDAVKGVNARLLICDMSGNDKEKHYIKSFYHNCTAFILVYDITNKKTFRHLNYWIEECKVQPHPIRPLFVVAGNKADMERKRKVSSDEGKAFADKYSMSFFEISGSTGIKVEEMFLDMSKRLYEMVLRGALTERANWSGFKLRQNPTIDEVPTMNRRFSIVKQISGPLPKIQKKSKTHLVIK